MVTVETCTGERGNSRDKLMSVITGHIYTGKSGTSSEKGIGQCGNKADMCRSVVIVETGRDQGGSSRDRDRYRSVW